VRLLGPTGPSGTLGLDFRLTIRLAVSRRDLVGVLDSP
jgi:hypothetical protein